MDPEKKISFGFSKQTKKPTVLRPPSEKKVELIECLEGQTIKVKNAVEEKLEPLVIPIKEDKRGIVDRIKEARAKQTEGSKKEKSESEEKPESELTLDELAARELIQDARRKLKGQNGSESGKILVLPTKDEKVMLDGEPEPTLQDYESVPISDYGLAMLRGMGWKDGMGIGKKAVKTNLAKPPEVRPKGLGLGATRIVQETSKEKACDKEGNALILKKEAFAKIIAGPHKNCYCQVLGLDDEAARIIVKTTLKEEVLSLNEFMVVPVTKEEYVKNSKVLNHAKYEEYKDKINNDMIKQENSNNVSNQAEIQSFSRKSDEHCSSYTQKSEGNTVVKKERHSSEKRCGDRYVKDEIKKERYSSQEQDRSKNKKTNKSRERDDASTTDSEVDRRQRHSDREHKHQKRVEKKHGSKSRKKERKESDDSSTDSEYEDKRKHHKRKDKRSRKDRSRTPRRSKSKKKSKHRSTSSDSECGHYRSKSRK